MDHGPSMNLSIRRRRFAEPELLKRAMKVPKSMASRARRVKNVARNDLGDTVGRLHMERQDFSGILMKQPRAIKRSRGYDSDETGNMDADGGVSSDDADAMEEDEDQSTSIDDGDDDDESGGQEMDTDHPDDHLMDSHNGSRREEEEDGQW